MTLAYLNGTYQPLAETKISALDRGFLFGDGVYEVIPVYKNNFLLRAEEHLTRLENSLKAINMSAPLSHAQWHKIFDRLLAEQHDETCSIYLQITRGADTKRGHLFPNPPVEPTVIAFLNHMPVKSKTELEQGFNVATHQDIRWNNCFIKAITLLPNLLLMQQAKQQGFDEVILVRDGYVTEACASNVFIVKDDIIITTPKSDGILGGITREYILEIITQHGLAYREENFTLEQLYQADEVWLTSSTKEVGPVIKVDQQQIANGKPGAMWRKVYALYQQHLQAEINA